jgi:hypothetical protein
VIPKEQKKALSPFPNIVRLRKRNHHQGEMEKQVVIYDQKGEGDEDKPS